MESRNIKRELSKEKKYSEKEIVLFLEKYLKGVFCGDYFSSCPWGIECNQQLYIAIDQIDQGKLDEFIKKIG